jgi:hypothetical protein
MSDTTETMCIEDDIRAANAAAEAALIEALTARAGG